MFLSNITKSIGNIEYSLTSPKSYLAFIPGISLIVQKVQLNQMLPIINKMKPPIIDDRNNDKIITKEESIVRNYSNLSKWHVRGSIIDIIISIALKIILGWNFIPMVISYISIYQIYNIMKANNSHTVIQHNDLKGNYKLEIPCWKIP